MWTKRETMLWRMTLTAHVLEAADEVSRAKRKTTTLAIEEFANGIAR